ncbi:MAG: glycosyltransferase family 4 protein [Chloroflexota bacterium]
MGHDPLLMSALVALIIAIAGVRLIEQVARRRDLLDHPNWRSSHDIPTPRLGGVGMIVAVVAASVAVSAPTGDAGLYLAAAVLMALVGLVDDLRSLSQIVRLVLQTLVALVLVASLHRSLTVELPGWSITIDGVVAIILGTVWIVGVLNIWNFMDGLDGIAAGTSAVVLVGLTALGGPAGVLVAAAAACLGFLTWNHSKASIFMGDSGSTFLGFLVACAVFVAPGEVPMVPLAIVLAPFLFDATFTLLVRARNRKPLFDAHREHLYQRLADSGVEHRSIVAGYWSAAAACTIVAVEYVGGQPAPQLLALVVIIATCLGSVAFVRRRERGRVESREVAVPQA